MKSQIGERNVAPIRVHELLGPALRAVVRRHAISRDQFCDLVAEAFPESAPTPENLNHLATDRASTFTNPLGIVSILASFGEVGILERLAFQAGFALVPLIEAEGTEAALLAAAASYQLDVAETQSEVAKALMDGKMTAERAAVILKELTEDERKLAGLRRSVQAALHNNNDTTRP
jgi:hypothetical protein